MSESQQKSGVPDTVVWILAIAAIGFIVAKAIPNHNMGPRRWPAVTCINNLRQIDSAANELALEHHLTNGTPIRFPDDLTNYVKLDSRGQFPRCPSGGIYVLKRIGDIPTCSLSNAVPPHKLP